MPHMKSYTRACDADGSLAWVAVTSANLSKAAWGELQKDATQVLY
jgi:tyrosyl-DNA phosphodiesterase-1